MTKKVSTQRGGGSDVAFELRLFGKFSFDVTDWRHMWVRLDIEVLWGVAKLVRIWSGGEK